MGFSNYHLKGGNYYNMNQHNLVFPVVYFIVAYDLKTIGVSYITFCKARLYYKHILPALT